MSEPRLLHPVTEKKESAKAIAAYADYEAMGKNRSLAKLAHKWGKRATYIGQLERWSSTFHWGERIAQYEKAQEVERQRKRAEAIDAMDDEHSDYARDLLLKAVEVLKKRLEKNDIGSFALVQLFEKAATLERLARGATTERIEQTSMIGGQIGFYPVQLPQKEEPHLALPGKYAENEETTITSNIA